MPFALAVFVVVFLASHVINILILKETSEFNFHEPSPTSMGWGPYMIYAFILTLMHHGYLVMLEWLQFGSFLTFLIKILATTAISMLLIVTVELLFPRSLKYRTNTA